MMTGKTDKPFAIYRLLPSLGEFRTLHLDEFPHRKLIRWLRTGSAADLPEAFGAEWEGDPRWPASEFPCGYPGTPVLSRRIADLLRDDLAAAGSFAPVLIDGANTREYVLYLVEKVVDCLDSRRSSKPKRLTGQIKKAVFRADALSIHVPAFRIPEFPGGVYWNGWAVDRLVELLGEDLETRLVWSEDPTLTPHPNPWGIL